MQEKVFLLGSESCGNGDSELGYSITIQLFETLAKSKELPAAIIMWNTAVNLMTLDSPALVHLKKIEARGVKILAGRLCVNELGVTDKIAVGQIIGMEEILGFLLNKEVVKL